MIVAGDATPAALIGARLPLHRGSLLGLRAPHVRLGVPGEGRGVAAGYVRQRRMPGPRQRRLAIDVDHDLRLARDRHAGGLIAFLGAHLGLGDDGHLAPSATDGP